MLVNDWKTVEERNKRFISNGFRILRTVQTYTKIAASLLTEEVTNVDFLNCFFRLLLLRLENTDLWC